MTPPPLFPTREPPAPHVVAVCSGKGGVGKSTVALNLAVALGAAGHRVGLLDADVHSPDIPLMVGLKRSVPAKGWQLARAGGLSRTPLEPVAAHGISIMSSGFIVAEDQALTWGADLVALLLNQLVWSTTWGPLDHLVIDLPPGTADVTQALFRVLPSAAALLVLTPQDVAHLDNRRVVAALRQSRVRVLGGVENMSGLHCPSCGAHVDLFPPVAPSRSVWAAGVPRLGTVPWGVADAEPVVLTAPGSSRGAALKALATAVSAAQNSAD